MKTGVGREGMFVIIYCGYEGIEHILWAGADAPAAAAKVKEIRRRIKKYRKENHPVMRVDEEDGHEYASESKYDLPYPWYALDSPEAICVQTEDNTQDIGFKCCCSDLKVGTKKQWLY